MLSFQAPQEQLDYLLDKGILELEDGHTIYYIEENGRRHESIMVAKAFIELCLKHKKIRRVWINWPDWLKRLARVRSV